MSGLISQLIVAISALLVQVAFYVCLLNFIHAPETIWVLYWVSAVLGFATGIINKLAER